MNKFIRQTGIAIALAGTILFAGCGGHRAKEDLDNELAYRQLGIAALEEANYQEATELFQKALDQSLAVVGDLEIDICYYKAISQYKAGDSQGALDTYTALINYDSENADAYYLRGSLYGELGQTEQAVSDYKAALSITGNNGKLYNRIAEKLIQTGNEEAVGPILEDALKVKGSTAEDYREKGYSFYLLGQYDSARTYLDKAINMGDKESVFYLAKTLEANGETEQAGLLYEAYVLENGEDTQTLNALGCAKMENGDYEQALAYFQTALATENPKNEQELRRNEISALECLLNFEKAKEKMKSYITDYPDDAKAVREYEFLRNCCQVR